MKILPNHFPKWSRISLSFLIFREISSNFPKFSNIFTIQRRWPKIGFSNLPELSRRTTYKKIVYNQCLVSYTPWAIQQNLPHASQLSSYVRFKIVEIIVEIPVNGVRIGEIPISCSANSKKNWKKSRKEKSCWGWWWWYKSWIMRIIKGPII